MLAAAAALVPLIRAHRDEAEAIRRLPAPVVDVFRQAGLLQIYLPRSMGGPEQSPLEFFQIIETLSQADGSAGWCAMIAGNISAFMGWLPAEIGRAMVGAPADFSAAGSVRPEGRATPVDGGYRVSGRWDFASGVHHARWLMCSCVVMDGDTPHVTEAGAPQTRTLWVPAESVRIEDTWSVMGMRGTGSHDFIVEDVFVPAERSFSLGGPPCEPGPLYNPRMTSAVLWTGTVGNALGIARGAIDAFVGLAGRSGTTMGRSVKLRDRPYIQARVGEAEAIVNAARAYVVSAVGEAWAAVCHGVPDPGREIAQARLSIVHGMHEAVRAVDLIFHAAGTNAVYTRNPLERHFRDVHVAVQHAAGLPGQYESAGKVVLGLRPSEPGW